MSAEMTTADWLWIIIPSAIAVMLALRQGWLAAKAGREADEARRRWKDEL